MTENYIVIFFIAIGIIIQVVLFRANLKHGRKQREYGEALDKRSKLQDEIFEISNNRETTFREIISDIFEAAPQIRKDYIELIQKKGLERREDLYYDIALSLDNKHIN